MRPACARLVARLDRLAHRARHRDRVLRARDRAGQQHARRSRPPSPARRRRRCRSPASRITGTRAPLDDQAQVVGVVDAHAAADRRAERHHRRAAGVLEPARQDRVVVGVGQHHEAVGHERLGGLEQLGGSGSSVRSSPITSSLTQSVSSASRASCAVVTASRAVKQPAVFGSTSQPASLEHLDDRAARAPGRRGACATVASSAPDARDRRAPSPRGCGSRRCRGSAASRSARPAISNASGEPPCTACRTSTLLAVAQLGARPTRRAAPPRRPPPPPRRAAVDAQLAHDASRRWRRRPARGTRR